MTQITLAKKLFKTTFLVLVWICIGLNLEIIGPTLIDLKLITNTNYEDVSRAASGRAFGFFIGAAIGGVLVEKFDLFCDLILALNLDLLGGFGILIPYLTDVSWMFLIILLQGICEGVINIAGQKLILEIWQENSASPMHALHLGFGIGSLVVPQISDPFLAIIPRSNLHTENVTSINYDNISTTTLSNYAFTLDMNSTINYTNSPFTVVPSNETYFDPRMRETKINWAYLIVAVVAFAVSVMFFIFQIAGKSYRNTTSNEMENKSHKNSNSPKSFLTIIDPKSCTDHSRCYGFQIFVLLFFLCFHAFGGEYVYGKFIRTYAIDAFNMDGDEASWLNTSFWISYTIGCFLGFLASRWVPIRILLIIESTGLMLSTVLFGILAGMSPTLLWIFTQPVGAFNAPTYPMCSVWGDHHVKMTAFGLAVISLGGSIGGIIYLWVVGHVYDTVGPQSFLHSGLAFGVLTFVTVISLHIISRGKERRFLEKSIAVKAEAQEEKTEVTYF